ncbi:MAG: phosphoribosylformylglycinamidine synthase subunit PurQ [Phycisphaerales bacterium]|nr:phosphoribosylformylglycinamidine synthase subunit PurQ [Phycisphaerales bacterium]
MPRPKALVLTAPGINCDAELCEAFDLAGAEPMPVHLNRLTRAPGLMDEAALIGLPGGFSYGDAVAAGRICAALIRTRIIDGLKSAVARGVPMIAPCNGFQIAVQTGLLPDIDGHDGKVALLHNDGGRFIDRWVRVEYPKSRCIWTRNLSVPEGADLLPIAHGEGRFMCDDSATMSAIDAAGQIAVRYGADDDPNGSHGLVGGICDCSGLVLGLMPHPERYLHWTQHPTWTAMPDTMHDHVPPGLAMFKNAVAHVSEPACTT